ncbi:MAG TPA: pyridoxal-phosphate dependent enzyme [Solirubrobacteraceae bacterium]|nr:pyridoxal-phosphate dependent enzyme [Solirubrobacteraceae bacterium]
MTTSTFDDVARAARTLEGVARRTPVLTSRSLDAVAGARLSLKAECFQRTGSFKIRGAYNHVSSLDDDVLRRGVVTISSGNHAQAVALAAQLAGTSALILMPLDAPPGKRAATEAYGAEVRTFDRYAEDRDELLAAAAAETGRHVVHAYDDERVIAGQGTVGMELLEEAGELDVLVVCVGGGGLISGCALAAKAMSPGTRVVGVEPEERPAARSALASGGPVKVPVPATLADGQQTANVGRRNHAVMASHVDEVVGVPDAEIVSALRLLFERAKVVVEPSGASALAAVLSGRVAFEPGARVGVTLSGGNVEAARLAKLLA